MGVSQNKGYHSGGPYDKDDSIVGSIWGSPNLGNSHMGQSKFLKGGYIGDYIGDYYRAY